MDINVLALSTGTQWRLKAITQHCPTDNTAATIMQQGPCSVYKLKLFSKQKPLHSAILNHYKTAVSRNGFNNLIPDPQKASYVIHLLDLCFKYDDDIISSTSVAFSLFL